MRMLQRGSGCFSMVLKEQNVFEAPVLFEIENAVPERPQNILDSFCRKRGQRRVVVRRFNDHFVRANAIHLVKHALGPEPSTLTLILRHCPPRPSPRGTKPMVY